MLRRRVQRPAARLRVRDFPSAASPFSSVRVLRIPAKDRERDRVALVAQPPAVRQYAPANAVVRILRAQARRECVLHHLEPVQV